MNQPNQNTLVAEYFRLHNACVLLAKDTANIAMLQTIADAFIVALMTPSIQPPSPYGYNPNIPNTLPYPGIHSPQNHMYQSVQRYMGLGVSVLTMLAPITAFLAVLENAARITRQDNKSTITPIRPEAAFNFKGTLVNANDDGEIYKLENTSVNMNTIVTKDRYRLGGYINDEYVYITKWEEVPGTKNQILVYVVSMLKKETEE